MQTETRIQDDPGLASRYLAGQLSPAELQAYEQHLLENPDAVRELEATARMKVGMASLRDSGQLEKLLRARPALRSPLPQH
jgi:anti-sigma factor RsiW